VSKYEGAVFDSYRLKLPQTDSFQQLWIQTYNNEEFTNIFGTAIHVKGLNILTTIIRNSRFYNNFSDEGAAVKLQTGGALWAINCTFTSDDYFTSDKDFFSLKQDFIEA